jgi:transgelin
MFLGVNGFKLMENIARFCQVARNYGLTDAEIFQTVDLYEKLNIHQVILCLFALGRKVI